MIVAIDGPAGSGKSTVAKQLARRLNFTHIETGSMYRAVAWKARKLGLDLNDAERVAETAKNLDLHFIPGPDGQRVHVDGEDASPYLKNVSQDAALVASYPGVRTILVARQRLMGSEGDSVMEGRDIGTDVFPNAEIKFYMDADPAERGRRRYEELKAQGQDVDLDHIIKQVKKRDHEDCTRKVSPLRKAESAILIETTKRTIEQVVEEMLERVQSYSSAKIP